MENNNHKEEDDVSLEKISSALQSFGKDRKNLIPILQMIQHQMAYIPPGIIPAVGRHLGISACEVYGVATFYNQFRFNPPRKHSIKVCLGTACHVKGGEIILENFERKLGIRDGETTPDREFSVERVACVGCCALAPVALVGETVQGHMAPSKVEGLILGFRIEKEKMEREKGKHEPGVS
jgi:NADH-quinone oxidoreductase subunit E